MACRRRLERSSLRGVTRLAMSSFNMAAGHCHAATSGRCRAVIDNQRHLAPGERQHRVPSAAKINLCPTRRRARRCRRPIVRATAGALRFPDEFPFHPPLRSLPRCVRVSVCPSVSPSFSVVIFAAAAAACVKYKMLSAAAAAAAAMVL